MKRNNKPETFSAPMKCLAYMTPLLFLLVVSSVATGATRYVDINNPSPSAPYNTWASAATNIQDAVDAAVAGDQVLVTNGVYQTGSRSVGFDYARVVVDKAIVIQSINGPQSAIIDGRRSGRCAVLTNGVTLAGFTLINGATFAIEVGGGGVAFSGYPSDAVVSNCLITGCIAHYGGAAGSANSANVYPPVGGTLVNCTISSNSATGNPFFYFPLDAGGGVDSCRLLNCTLIGNNASGPTQSKGGGAYASILQNCLLIGNGTGAGSAGGGAANSALINCTVVSNSASSGAGAYACWLTNCIVTYNSTNNHDADNFVAYTCTTPMPTNGFGNITNAPLFAGQANGNFRLLFFSPCVDAGNTSYVTSSVDLDGKERIVGRAVDMGAYEWSAVTHYVSLDSPNPTPPYLSWSAAATNIQDAVDAAALGDQVLVTNGIYSSVAASKRLNLRSVNGPRFTFIRGYPGVRCVTLNGFASLSGFTLTNGSVSNFGATTTAKGGGVSCGTSTGNVISNCVLIGNSADQGGGAYGGILINCTLMNNSAKYDGGGAYGSYGNVINRCALIDCTVIGNRSGYLDGGGGGVYNCSLTNCTLVNNSDLPPTLVGNGAVGSTLDRCALVANPASRCLIYDSYLTQSDYYAAAQCSLYNCTLTGNTLGAYGSDGWSCDLWNCIVYYNSSDYYGNCSLNFCCTPFMPTNGIGNITDAPIFIDGAGGNLRLQSNSPCINAGQNAYAGGFRDFDGNPRIAGRTVDIGAFEFQSPSSVLSYAWAQQYGLPTDGSADYADADGDSMSNWLEWIAGTDPTNSFSSLRLLLPTNDLAGVVVRWQSVSNRAYFLERSTQLGSGSFSSVASNVAGQAGTTTFIDTNTTGAGVLFYRVGVQP